MSQFDKQLEQRYLELLDSVPLESLQPEAQLIAFERLKKQRIYHKRLIQTTISVAILMIAFIGSIRVSPAIAHAVAQIPGLKPIVEMIAFDKGIEDIVNNDYFEQMNESQTINGKTLTITGVVADESGMIISYKLKSDEDLSLFTGVTPEVKQKDKLVNAGVVYGWTYPPGGTYEVEDTINVTAASQGMDYSSRDFVLKLALRERPETVFEIPFTLKKEIKASKRFTINKKLTVDGQRFTIHELIISPIRSELRMSIDSSNSKKILKFDDIRLYDENKEEWGKIRNGVVGFGEYKDEQFSILLESNYFRMPESITIEMRKIEAIDKADEFIVVDFGKKKVISHLNTIDIELEVKDNYEIEYKVPSYKNKNEHKGVFNNLIDADGEIYRSYSVWISPQKNYMLIGQHFDMENAEKPPTNPVKLDIARYEQYLNGTGRIKVELNSE
ncbi:DUF4179 domain-containing protein [Bacillus sp. FJAT-27245]|uniref:DUF4179 domain-containing protein n=1 Tax=Bacillus sp. FJAT-27245 TaxID=1684144 RepID=UPI0006A7B4EB|nr:DUF4179 domain-containing protein [Bacillus sp. FJAT-27245]